MHGLRVMGSRLLGLFRKRRLDENLDEELRSHLQLLTDEKMRRGMTPQEAREAARREFGGVEQTKEAYRDQRGVLLRRFTYSGRAVRIANPFEESRVRRGRYFDIGSGHRSYVRRFLVLSTVFCFAAFPICMTSG